MPDVLHEKVNGFRSLVESLVFASDGPVSVETLAATLEQDQAIIEGALAELEQEYSGHGIRLERSRDRIQIVTSPEAAPFIQKLLGLEGSARLSAASLETLAIIAYRQPITRPQIEGIRGVNCDGVIHNLLARSLIEETGRLETVGHPIQYATTFEFLQYFGLGSVMDLPPLPDDFNFELGSKNVSDLLRGRESEPVLTEFTSTPSSQEEQFE